MRKKFDPSKWQLRFGFLFLIVLYLGAASLVEYIIDDPVQGLIYGYMGGLIPFIGVSIYADTRLKKTTEESLSQADKDFDLKPDILVSILAYTGAFLFVYYSFDFPLRDIIVQGSLLAGSALSSFIYYIIRMKGKGYGLEDGTWVKRKGDTTDD